MRIRNYRPEDLPTLVQIQQLAACADGYGVSQSETAIETWLKNPETSARSNAFVITDDDDELNTWGQAGTLDGIEGEIIGYTTLTLSQDQEAYHLLCQGVVHPQQRQRGAGRLLLVGALNRARILAADFEFEAEQDGIPVYFEALLPRRNTTSSRLTEKCEMQAVDEERPNGMQLYRRELW
ncbi:MAG: hypothetical protein NVSMB49_09290 [Ktedonobacteraceae bacterium]